MTQFNLSRSIRSRVVFLRKFLIRFWNHVLMCSIGKPVQYRVLPPSQSPSPSITPSPSSVDLESGEPPMNVAPLCHNDDIDSDLISLKISLLGDSQIGKTSFLEKYVEDPNQQKKMGSKKNGLTSMDKTLFVKSVRISYSIWELQDDSRSVERMAIACQDSVAILFMFDLSSRRTLNSVIRWYQEATKWNQRAILILIGTKFDEFIQLPIDLQWTIASQARAYAKAMNATLFFSSATYNINVNKIFKFITAKLFDLPWTVERNLTIGEPIIDF
ncbi:septum-promoting GTP-binding protein 1-like [Tripterygium wilfordii]|uniref:Septum-promoting GTP-binding protein 1-like n=1 Tax=Tripterygium wilfordii TaxID=458696 RepID=A0A7J7DI84_TRIWF|nr:septum-promoting GTP-binding protein 1-like [Tripterygium wilfordii]KAF5746061.1 septum-promoting GTP-binding protein 1-like [Tripterygium wilfordii]